MNETAKILVIDDDLFVLKVTELLLVKHGFTVNGTQEWREGMKLWTEWEPDVVLLDLMMPGKTGWEVLDEMRTREDYKEIPVIAFTAKDEPAIEDETREHRAYGYVLKPFDHRDLINKIEEALASVRSKA